MPTQKLCSFKYIKQHLFTNNSNRMIRKPVRLHQINKYSTFNIILRDAYQELANFLTLCPSNLHQEIHSTKNTDCIFFGIKVCITELFRWTELQKQPKYPTIVKALSILRYFHMEQVVDLQRVSRIEKISHLLRFTSKCFVL